MPRRTNSAAKRALHVANSPYVVGRLRLPMWLTTARSEAWRWKSSSSVARCGRTTTVFHTGRMKCLAWSEDPSGRQGANGLAETIYDVAIIRGGPPRYNGRGAGAHNGDTK